MPSTSGFGLALSNLGSEMRQNAATQRAQQERALERAFQERQFQAQQNNQARQAAQEQQFHQDSLDRWLKEDTDKKLEEGVLRTQPGATMDPALAEQASKNPGLAPLIGQQLGASQSSGLSTLPVDPQAQPGNDSPFSQAGDTQGPAQPPQGMLTAPVQTPHGPVRVGTWAEAQAQQEAQRAARKDTQEQTRFQGYLKAVHDSTPEQQRSINLGQDRAALEPGFVEKTAIDQKNALEREKLQGSFQLQVAGMGAKERNRSENLSAFANQKALLDKLQSSLQTQFKEDNDPETKKQLLTVQDQLRSLLQEERTYIVTGQLQAAMPTPVVPPSSYIPNPNGFTQRGGFPTTPGIPQVSPESRAQQLIREALAGKK